MLEHPDVSIGHDGWLFLKRGTNRSFEQLTGTYPLSERFSDDWAALFSRRAAYCADRGIRHVFMVCPAKEAVYSNYLPKGISVSDHRPVSQVIAAADDRVDLVYPLDAFRAEAHRQQLYGRQDTHWTAAGSIMAYRSIATKLGLEPIAADRIESAVGPMNDLGAKIGFEPEQVGLTPRVRDPVAGAVYDNKIKPQGSKIIFEATDKSLPTAVIFRDSFLTQSLVLFAQHFRRLVCLWQPNWDWGVLDEEKPDYIIGEQAERFLVEVPDDVNGMTNAEYVAQKRAKAKAASLLG